MFLPPHLIPDRYAFDECYINDVCVHPVAAYEDYDGWYDALIDLLPSLPDDCMELFFECGFHPFIFLRMTQWLPTIRKEDEDLTDTIKRLRSTPVGDNNDDIHI